MRQKLFKLFMVTAVALISSQFIQAQDKTELVNKLIELTVSSHPSELEQRMAENKVDAKKYEAEERRDYAEFLTSALKANTQLTAEQKAFVGKNLSKLVDRVAFEVLVIQERNNNTGKWLRQSLRQNYSAKLTAAELTELTNYFAKKDGKNTLNYIATSPERKASGTPNYLPEEFLAYSAFIKTVPGNKFFNIFVTDAEADMRSKFTVGNKQMRAEMNKLYETASLNQIINQFVTENVGQPSTDKAGLVNQLAETFVNWKKEIEKQMVLESANDQAEMGKAQKENYAEIFDEALKENKSLTVDQKAFTKANYDKLGEILMAKQKAITNSFLPIDVWLKQGLTTSVTNYLTVDEINNINTFLQNSAAKDLIMRKESGSPELDKFAETVAGSKFLTILKEDLAKFIESQMQKAMQKYMEESAKLLEPTEINKLINEFVEVNYKK